MSDLILRLRAPIDESSSVKLVWELLNQRKEAADELEQVWEMFDGLQDEVKRLDAEIALGQGRSRARNCGRALTRDRCSGVEIVGVGESFPAPEGRERKHMDEVTQGPFVAKSPLHEDRIERLDPVFYIRWTSGPDYEKAFICVEDGEPDMNEIACVSFNRARGFAEWYRHAMDLRR